MCYSILMQSNVSPFSGSSAEALVSLKGMWVVFLAVRLYLYFLH